MPCGKVRPGTVEVALDTRHQTREHIMKAVEAMLVQHNVIQCGIMVEFAMRFAEHPSEVDTSTKLKEVGVVSVRTTTA